MGHVLYPSNPKHTKDLHLWGYDAVSPRQKKHTSETRGLVLDLFILGAIWGSSFVLGRMV